MQTALFSRKERAPQAGQARTRARARQAGQKRKKGDSFFYYSFFYFFAFSIFSILRNFPLKKGQAAVTLSLGDNFLPWHN